MNATQAPAPAKEREYLDVLPEKDGKSAAIFWFPIKDQHSPNAGYVRIEDQRGTAVYLVTSIPTKWSGRAFFLSKIAGGTDRNQESYSVFCAKKGEGESTCECRGFLRWRTPCKHLLTCQTLITNQWV